MRALVTPRSGSFADEMTGSLECTSCGLCDVACPAGLDPRALVQAVARAAVENGLSPTPAAQVGPPRLLSIKTVALRLGLGEDPPVPAWSA